MYWFWYLQKRFKCYKTQLVTWDGPVLGDVVKIIPKGQRLKTGKRPIWHIIHSCWDLIWKIQYVETLEPKTNDTRDKRSQKRWGTVMYFIFLTHLVFTPFFIDRFETKRMVTTVFSTLAMSWFFRRQGSLLPFGRWRNGEIGDGLGMTFFATLKSSMESENEGVFNGNLLFQGSIFRGVYFETFDFFPSQTKHGGEWQHLRFCRLFFLFGGTFRFQLFSCSFFGWVTCQCTTGRGS